MKKLLFILFLAFSASAFAQTGIGTTTPNASAQLDVTSTNKGFLPPRVALTSTTAFAPLAAHVEGMVVYNTATVNDVTPGLYSNNGTAWIPSGGSVVDATTTTKGIVQLAGDLGGSAASPSVLKIGGVAPTNINTANAVVKRDASGGFAAGYGNFSSYVKINDKFVLKDFGSTSVTLLTSPNGSALLYFSDNASSGGVGAETRSDGSFVPNGDNTKSLGISGNRWKEIWGYTLYYQNSQSVSDERVKEDINPLDEKYVNLIRNINPVEFEWIENKNGKNMGVTVQQVEQAMVDAGFSVDEYSLINKKNPEQYMISSIQLISPLIKFAQNLEEELNSTKQELADLKALLKSKGLID